jgi:transketolase
MGVYCPSDEAELVEALPSLLSAPGPCYIRLNLLKPHLSHRPYIPGRAEVVSEGEDVALLTYGFLLGEALSARAILEESGLSVRLVNLRSLKPVDEGEILFSARNSRLLVTLEDHFTTGGLHSIVAEVLLRQKKTARTLPIGLDEEWFKPALLGDVLSHEGFTGAQIADRILSTLEVHHA